ncbi:hypothetical protein M441DRAFT_235639 [Trichoderma asperellum CBS 433.97]|uniref:Uncharacterized protein n=1 Tax=Trichoderma asperellum (strain ATCC 204424 / CBS 433.97 / NBRC 101777) TaxID=1042311 RepID=A0A2T3Z199_TRIA4|nr:hypothetical protein M441DRAFT_235639 [Trichoderma asperellum CBS 433.97]PTB38572.1 hypothetical protein M441DRAFT_235639 [Trichoderma asperellum CBS 433.97]
MHFSGPAIGSSHGSAILNSVGRGGAVLAIRGAKSPRPQRGSDERLACNESTDAVDCCVLIACIPLSFSFYLVLSYFSYLIIFCVLKYLNIFLCRLAALLIRKWGAK